MFGLVIFPRPLEYGEEPKARNKQRATTGKEGPVVVFVLAFGLLSYSFPIFPFPKRKRPFTVVFGNGNMGEGGRMTSERERQGPPKAKHKNQ